MTQKTTDTENNGIWWHEDNLGPLENLPYIKHFGSMKFSKVRMDKNMLPHLNDGIEIHFVHSGKYNWIIDQSEIQLLPDSLSLSAPWQLNGSPLGKMEMGQINWLVIKPEEFTLNKPLDLGSWTNLSAKFQENLGNMVANEDNMVIEKAKSFKKYFIELENELSDQKEGYEIKVGNIIENLFIDLYRHLSFQEQKNHENDNFIDALTKKILYDLNKKWVIDDLAYKFGMGKTKFTSEVKKLTGYPPHSFIINLRIAKAIELIKSDKEMSMSDIACTCGFSSLQHFTSAFSHRIGISPGKYNK